MSWYDWPDDEVARVRQSQTQGGLRLGSQPPAPEALRELEELFSGGGWQPRVLVIRVCKRHHISPFAALDYLAVAESDHGLWMCRPSDSTPILPPDEIAVLSGLSPRSSLPEDLHERLRALRTEPVAVAS